VSFAAAGVATAPTLRPGWLVRKRATLRAFATCYRDGRDRPARRAAPAL